jgi:hypothetical protein
VTARRVLLDGLARDADIFELVGELATPSRGWISSGSRRRMDVSGPLPGSGSPKRSWSADGRAALREPLTSQERGGPVEQRRAPQPRALRSPPSPQQAVHDLGLQE